MRYAVARSLATNVRAGVISATEIAEAVSRIVDLLQRFSPDVEPFVEDPGVSWLSGRGLSRHFPSWEHWAHEVQNALAEAGFASHVAVGFTRFGTFAAAKSNDCVRVFDDPTTEKKRIRCIPVSRLGIDVSTRDALERLGVTTLGAFIDLPGPSVLRRFGSDVHRLMRLAKGELWAPLQPVRPNVVFRETCRLDDPERHHDRLIVLVEEQLESLVSRLGDHRRQLAALDVTLDLEDGRELRERLGLAEPTLDSRLVLSLVKRWLERVALTAGVVGLTLDAEPRVPCVQQVSMLDEHPRRDLRALDRALARLRARFGDHAVVTAMLCSEHLPEARVRLAGFERVTPAAPSTRSPQLVRRMFMKPRALPPRPRREPDGWLVAGVEGGPVEEVLGPFLFSGGWWLERIERVYHYVRTARRQWLWVFEDRERRAWFQHGEVE
jgi:protein ImuB